MSGEAVAAILLIVLASAVVAGNRARLAGQARAAAQVRPVLFSALDGVIDQPTIDALKPAQRRAFKAQALSLLPKLKGQDKETLARLLDRRGAIEAARHRSHSKWASRRAQAGEFLGEAGSPATVHDMLDLLDLLADPDAAVRCSAARALGRLGNPGALSPLLASLEGERAVPVDVVADAVFQIRDCPVAMLRHGLESQSVPTRCVAVELLGRFQALAAAEDVIDLLYHDPSEEVRVRAARCLGRMETPRGVDPLLSCLVDEPVALRVQAIAALGEIGSQRAIPSLQAIVLTSSRPMAETAALALVTVGPRGMRALTQIAEGGGHASDIAAGALATHHDLENSLHR